MKHSQPLSEEFSRQFRKYDKGFEDMTEENISLQYVGDFFAPTGDEIKKEKFHLGKWLARRLGRIKDKVWQWKISIRNHVRWHKTIRTLIPYDGYRGMIELMRTQLKIYVDFEEKHGVAEETYKARKIASAKEAIALLTLIVDPVEHTIALKATVEAKYPEHQSLITHYKNGCASTSGAFVVQGKGWAGYESGLDPRRGYFEFVDGKFALVESPDLQETERLLAEIDQCEEEEADIDEQAEADIEQAFDRLGELMKEHLYTWWD